jgi:hypothetical protein
MLISKLLRAKKLIVKNGQAVVDLISSTFNLNIEEGPAAGLITVLEEEEMRPDLLSNRLYGTTSKWDALLKYNGISNPFSLSREDFLLAPSFRSTDKLIVPPFEVTELGIEPSSAIEEKILNPKSEKDKKRIEALKNRSSEVLPPNINQSGVRNFRKQNGEIIIGNNSSNVTESISRQKTIENFRNNIIR